jgi:protein-tyrosine kinase
MSRIHEALKRAEQERVNQSPEREAAAEQVAAPSTPEAGHPSPSASAGPQVDQPAIFADTRAESNAQQEVSTGPAWQAPVRPEFAARSHNQQFIRFDDIWQASQAPGWHINSQMSVFTDPGAANIAAEQFRTLRSRLYQLRDRQPLKTILITSAAAGEGKTFIATNLAQSLARQQGCKVLLIDGDLRSPGLHAALGAPLTPGLSDYLKGTASDTAIVQRGAGDLLGLIPAGSHTEDASELLANGRLKLLLDKLAPIFDWVIIDSPPVLPVSDALILADCSDGVVPVVRSAFTDLDRAQKACQELNAKNLLGVVLNCADEGTTYTQYGTYASGFEEQAPSIAVAS